MRDCVTVKPRPARLILMTSAPARIENSMPRIRSLTLKLPSREARTATTSVLPPTPCRRRRCRRSPRSARRRTCRGRRSRSRRCCASVCRTCGRCGRRARMAHVDAGVDDGHRTLRAAAGRGQRVGRAHVVVEPGELDAGGGSIASKGSARRAGCGRVDVGDARSPRSGATRADPEGARAASTPIVLSASGSAPRLRSRAARAGTSAWERARPRARVWAGCAAGRRLRRVMWRSCPASGSGTAAWLAPGRGRLMTSRSVPVFDRVGCLGKSRRQRRRTGKDGEQRPSHTRMVGQRRPG